MADSLILMVLALVVFGPRRLPQIGRQIGKLMYEFRKASNDFKFQMEEELRNAEESDRRKKEEERLKALSLAAPAVETPAADAPTAEAGAATPTASPYPWESVYPSVSTPAAEAPPEEAATPPAEEMTLQVQPPSTGEMVAAAPPKRVRRKRTPKAPASEEAMVAAPPESIAVQPDRPQEPDTFHSAAEQAWKEAEGAVVPDAKPQETAATLAAEVRPSIAPEASEADGSTTEQSGTIPEQAHNG